MPSPLARLLPPLALSLACAQGGGVTVFTHGNNSTADTWVQAMAPHIAAYPGFPGSDLTVYRIEIAGSDGAYTTTVARTGGPPPDQSDSGEIFVALDWNTISNTSATSSTEVAEVAAAALLSTTLIAENNGQALAELPLHLAGHSRGASVASEIARFLGDAGVWVDHLTLWDPYPLGSYGDGSVAVWENVLFADNYYQQLYFIGGSAVAGAYNRQLTSLSGGYGLFSGGQHSNVHLWYHGTLQLDSPASDGAVSLTASMRSTWYNANESAGATAGFHYSRIGGGDRLATAPEPIADGYNQMWDLGAGSMANRASLPTPVDPWPNVIVARRTTAGPLDGGDPLPLEVLYQSEVTGVGDPTLTLLLDPDPNPWNGNEIELSSEILTGSGFNDVLTATPAPVIPAATDGSYFLHARIAEDGRTRYLNLRDPLAITAALPPPTIAAGSLRFESGLFTFTVNGTAGQEVVVEGTTTLSSWQTLDTVTLGAASQDWSDPDSAGFTRRYYRVGPAP